MVLPFRYRHEGRTRRHERGVECGGREGAEGRAASARTAKSCGPGAPRSGAKSSSDSKGCTRAPVANGMVHRGERGVSRKPLRREGRLSPPVPVVFALAQIFFAREPRVHAATRPSLRPLIFEGKTKAKTRAKPAARTQTCIR